MYYLELRDNWVKVIVPQKLSNSHTGSVCDLLQKLIIFVCYLNSSFGRNQQIGSNPIQLFNI